MEDLERSFPQVQPEEEQDMVKFNFDSTPIGMSSSIPESPNMVSSNEDMISEPQIVRQRSNASIRSGVMGRSGEKVVVCSSNASVKRHSTLMRTKPKSRLMDQPDMDQRSHTTPRSGIHGKGSREFEQDEFSIEDDMPDEYKTFCYNKWTLLQLTSLILIMGALACTLSIPKLRNEDCYELHLWRWEVIILVVVSGRLVSGWGITILVFFIERSSFLRKRVLYFIYSLKKQVQNCFWLTLVLITWKCTFEKKVEKLAHEKVLPYVTKICICLLLGNIFWLLKTLLIKVLDSSFHVNKFFDRIQDSLFNQYVIETLSGAPVIEIQQKQEEEDRLMEEVEKFQRVGMSLPAQLKTNILKGFEGIRTPTSSTPVDGKKEASNPKKNDNAIPIDHLHKLNQKNISAWNMHKMMNIINTKMLTTSDKRLQDETSIQITNEKEAKIAAKNIFCNVAKPGSRHIYLEDLMQFVREDEALKIIRLLDDARETKGISKRALKTWMVNVFRERRSLALSLYDTKTAVDNLHQMLNVVVGIILTVIWIIILRFATTQFFIFLSSQLVLVAFVFGNACKTLFEAIIFVFVVHPFDVGDRCEIDGVQMIVEEMDILTTIFLRYDNQKIAYPNSVLSTKPIANYHRSPDMDDAIDVCIHVSNPTEKVAKMKERITSYVEKKSDHWKPRPIIVVRDVEDLNRIKISVWVSHRMNFQNMGERWMRRALLVEEMINIFKDLDIEYRMLPLDINVRNIPALASNRLPSNWTACAN